MIKNKFFIGQKYWHIGYLNKSTEGILSTIYSQGYEEGLILAYEFQKVAFNFREDQIFLTKEEAENAVKT